MTNTVTDAPFACRATEDGLVTPDVLDRAVRLAGDGKRRVVVPLPGPPER